jgi:hypothetical protein
MSSSGIESTLIRTVVEDVLIALSRVEQLKTDESRRTAVRTIAAAIEAMVWMYRDEVIEVAMTLETCRPEDEQALAVRVAVLDSNGAMHWQPRHLPVLSHFRYLANLAERCSTRHQFDFAQNGWSQVQDTMRLRNRMMHPKSRQDLIADPEAVDSAFKGFDWLCREIVSSMDAIISELRDYTAEVAHVVERLRSGDPVYLALYERVKSNPRKES